MHGNAAEWKYYEAKMLWVVTIMQSDQEKYAYEQLFIRFSKLVERWLLRFTVLFIVMLICFQALLQISYFRMLLTRVEPLEGKPYLRNEEIQKGDKQAFRQAP
jgi:hypothetical protein